MAKNKSKQKEVKPDNNNGVSVSSNNFNFNAIHMSEFEKTYNKLQSKQSIEIGMN